jgi:ATP-binding cassette subfamily B protein
MRFPMRTESEKVQRDIEYRSGQPIRTLWQMLGVGRWSLFGSAVFFLIKHSPTWLLPVFFARMVGIIRVPAEHSASDLFWVLGIMLALVVQNIPTHVIYTRLMSGMVRNLECRLRQAIVRRLQQLSMGYYGDQQRGRLQAKLLRDVEAVGSLCQLLVDHGLSGVVGVAFAFSYTISKDPRAALLYIAIIPVAILIQRSLRGILRRRNQEFRKAIESMSARLSEMIDMLPITRAHSLEEYEVKRVNEHLEGVVRTGVRVDVANAVFAALSWVVMRLANILFLGLVGYQVFKTGLPKVEDFILFYSFFEMILGSVSTVLHMTPAVTRGLESVRSIGEVMECPDLEQNEGKPVVTRVAGAFRFENVTFRYAPDRAPAIQGFSLDVRPGECVAFVGPSGSGKSTLMNLIIGFRRPTEGRILLDGADMQSLDLRTYRRRIAVIPQETFLFGGSIRENITYGLREVPEGRLAGILEASNITEFLKQLPDGLDTVVGEHGAKLSGGQRQRIAIARALIRDPYVILLDEATSALDVVSEKFVQEAIDRLVVNRTTFIVAHRLSTIRRAGRIVVLKDGRCIEVGSHDDLMQRRSEFYRLKSLQT